MGVGRVNYLTLIQRFEDERAVSATIFSRLSCLWILLCRSLSLTLSIKAETLFGLGGIVYRTLQKKESLYSTVKDKIDPMEALCLFLDLPKHSNSILGQLP